MSNTSANVRNLNDGRAQALQALSRVSDRLGEILGEAANIPGDGTSRNENGELVNEEGLPIIDITEPVDDLDTPSLSAATEDGEVIEEDNYPEPISKLSPEALAVSRKHRDKILELLEEEESREERRTKAELQAELEKKREAARSEMQKRMVIQSADLDKRRRAKEMEKKMAKALISGLGDPEPTSASTSASRSKDTKEKKSVTFADLPPSSEPSTIPDRVEEQAEATGWGDVVPGRLPKKRIPLSSQSQPMKMEVVERVAAPKSSPSTPPPPPEPEKPAGDSDDESNSELSSDSTIALESGDEDVVLSAHRHRELALEYHRRREALASSASDILPEDIGLSDDGADGTPANWNTEDVPLEATLAHPPPKALVSKFKASLNPTDGSPSTLAAPSPPSQPEPLNPAPSSTFGVSVLPPGALAKSVKMGKLVNGNLVAGDEDEEEKEREEREEEEIRKLLLKSMEDYSGIAAQVMGPAAGSYWAKPEAEDVASSSSVVQQPTVKPKPKASRFKVNRTQPRVPPEAAAGPSTTPPPAASTTTPGVLAANLAVRPRSNTPVSGAGRSSPKLTPRGPSHAVAASINSPSNPLQPTIIDSPSFAPRGGGPSKSSARARPPSSGNPVIAASQSTVIDSPSFPQATIIDSPSFLRPTGIPSNSQTPSQRKSPTVISTQSTRSADRAATIMAPDVRESSGDRSVSASGGSDAKPQRVSRFKAERGG